jgi:hypothetical protein
MWIWQTQELSCLLVFGQAFSVQFILMCFVESTVQWCLPCVMQHELEKIQSLLEQFEMDMIERDSQAENIVAEVNELRSHVLKLRFQLDVVDTSSTMDAIQSDWVTLSPSSHELT